jgi:hypothetical protein
VEHPDDRIPPYLPGAEDSELLAETHAEVGASPLTYEGVIQGYGKIARTARRGTGWRRTAALAVAVIMLIPFALILVSFVIRLF